MSFKTSNPRHIRKGTLVGAFDLDLPSGLKINGVMLFEKDGKRWINFPSKEYLDKDGAKKYSPLLEFTSPEVRDRFQSQVLPLAEQALAPSAPAASKLRGGSAPMNDDIPFAPEWR